MRASPTRGRGLLEAWLADRRARAADALLPARLRAGTIVDVGCGAPPLFLERTRFARKTGIDLRAEDGTDPTTGIHLVRHDASKLPLPLPDASADAVAMLAMIEHVPAAGIPALLEDIRRILKPGGMLVITSPTPLAAFPLWSLSRIGFVSRVEIDDHERLLAPRAIEALLGKAGWKEIRSGRFECGMNAWYAAVR